MTAAAKSEESAVVARVGPNGEQFRVIDPARVPQRPFSPNRPRLFGMGALMGFALGLGLAVLLEYRDTSLKTDDDVLTALTIPVLAMVPIMMTKSDVRRRHRMRRAGVIAATLLVVAAVAAATWTSSGKPDMYRLLRAERLPFDLSPNPKYLLMTPRHREALANLHAISSRKSITLLLGEAGTGKTTLVRAALESDACRGARILHLNNPALNRNEFIEFLARGFDLGAEAMTSKTAMLHELERVLRERRAEGETIALVIDEAQSLSHELLEEIRLLANIETSTEKLLPVVLAGQPELADRLNGRRCAS
jgi:hypothetical protein